MILVVDKPFVGQGFNMPAPGTLIDAKDDVAEYLIGIGVAHAYETKVTPLPDIKKNDPLSASSRPAHRVTKKTRRRSKKSVKKS